MTKRCSEEGKCVGEAWDRDEVFIQNPPIQWDGDFPQEEDEEVGRDERPDGGYGLGELWEETCGWVWGLPVLCVDVGGAADA